MFKVDFTDGTVLIVGAGTFAEALNVARNYGDANQVIGISLFHSAVIKNGTLTAFGKDAPFLKEKHATAS